MLYGDQGAGLRRETVVCCRDGLVPIRDRGRYHDVELKLAGGGIWLDEWVTTLAVGKPVTNGVEIYVADTCGGIPEARLRTIWQIGQTDKAASRRRHLGFGLWWVRSFSRRVGGMADVKSPVEVEGEQGCQFSLRLPLRGRRPPGLDTVA
jgi:signal transduction histidine kinase